MAVQKKTIATLYDLLALPEKLRIGIFGTGTSAEHFLELLEKVRADFKPVCFIDEFQDGEKCGLPVYTLEKFMRQAIDYDIIITAVPENDFTEIEKKFKSFGIERYQFSESSLLLGDPLLCIDWEDASFDIRRLVYGNHEELFMRELENYPKIDATFSRISIGMDGLGSVFDIIDFSKRKIDRWWIPEAPVAKAVETLKTTLSEEKYPPDMDDHDYLYHHNLKGHTCHVSPHQHICSASVFYNYFIDIKKNIVSIFPENYDEELMVYSDTGCFSSNYEYWYFVRWPIRHAHDLMHDERKTVRCQIGRVKLEDLHIEILYELDYLDRVHQIRSFSDKYLVFTSWKQQLNIPYPETPIDQDPRGYQKSHASGLKLTKMVTVDLEAGTHWFTKIPAPIPAHFEADPVDANVFYVSAHNLANHMGEVIIEGPGTIFKVRICEASSVIEDKYSDEAFFRITEHLAFRYKNRTYLAVTNLPNKLDLIDAEKMILWRRVELFEYPSFDFKKTGNAVCPQDSRMYLSLEASKDGRYIVLESMENFAVYDIEKNILWKEAIPSYALDGYVRVGHTRAVGL